MGSNTVAVMAIRIMRRLVDMLKKLLAKLLGHHPRPYGKPYQPRFSSDDYRKRGRGPYPGQHNQYGHGYYQKKRGSGSYSS